jgi:hypothetical protein
MTMILLLKAIVKKTIWVEGYTKPDGTYVRPHQTTVNASTDHDDHKVASGQGKGYQIQAHKHLSKQEEHKNLPVDKQSNNILHLATAMQKEASANSDVNTLKNKIIAGKKPTAGEWKALSDAKPEKVQGIIDKIKAAGQFDFYSSLAVEHVKNADEAKDKVSEKKQESVKQEEKPVVEKKAPEKKKEKVKADEPKAEDKKPEPEKQEEKPAKKESPRHAAALNEMAGLPSGNYKKQAHSELSAHPDWNSWGDKEKHDKVVDLYKQKQGAATSAANVAKFKKTIKAGGVPTGAQLAAVMSLPGEKKEAFLASMADEVGGKDKLKELLLQAEAKSKKTGSSEPKAEPLKESIDDILSQSTQVAEEAQAKKDAADWKPSMDEVMAIMKSPKEKQQAKLKEFANKMGSAEKLSDLLHDYQKQAIDNAKKTPAPVNAAAEKAPKKEPEPAKNYQAGDELEKSDLGNLPPGTIVQLYSKDKPWKQALVGNNAVWLAKTKGGGYYKEPLSSSQLSQFYSGSYSDNGKHTVVSVGHSDWMSDQQKNTVAKIAGLKVEQGQVADVHKLKSKLVVVGDMSKPVSLFWVDDSGLFGAGFTNGQKKAIAEGNYTKIGSGDQDNGPKNGDTKEGADGALVFKDGRWHKQGEKEAAAPKMTAKEHGSVFASTHSGDYDSETVYDDEGFYSAHLEGKDADSHDALVSDWWDGFHEKKAEPKAELEIKQFTHSQKGHQVYAVPLPVKLSNDDYKKVLSIAKGLGGFYSSFKKDGAVPGFHFKSHDDAQAFSEKAAALISTKEDDSANAEPEAVADEKATGNVPTKTIGGVEFLTDGEGWIKQYANMAQAIKSAQKIQDMGYEVHISAKHPFNIIIDSKPGEAEPETSEKPTNAEIKEKIMDLQSKSGVLGLVPMKAAINYLDKNPGDLIGAAKLIDDSGWPSNAKELYKLADELGITKEDGHGVLGDKKSAQAPVGTEVTLDGTKYLKTEAGWVNTKTTSQLPADYNVPAILEIVSGHNPSPEWYSKGENHKLTVAFSVMENGASVNDTLKAVFPDSNDGDTKVIDDEHYDLNGGQWTKKGQGDGPKEGDTKVINGVTYVLKDGRWHKVGEDEKAVNPGSIEEALNAVAAPDLSMLSAYNQTSISKGLEILKNKVALEGSSAFKGSITKGKAKGTLSFKLKGDYSQGVHAVGGKAYVDYDADGNPINFSSATSGQATKVIYEYIEALKAANDKFNGKKPKKKSVKKAPASSNQEFVHEVVSAGITKIDGWEKVGEQKGSNPGGSFKDKSGNQWYCKFPSNPDTVKNELLAAKFYQMMGIAVPNLKLVEKDGKLGIASKWKDGLKVGSASELSNAAGTHDAFAIDAWLGNWDVVGLSNDNLMLDSDGKAIRVDVGGSLLYRAQGEAKGDSFGNDVTELKTLIDSSKNSQSAAVFGGMSEEAIKDSAKRVAKMKPGQIRKMVEMFGPGDDNAKKSLADKLIARRKSIMDQTEVRDPWEEHKVDDENLNVNAADLPEIHDFANWNGPGKGLSSSKYYNDLNQSTEQEIYDLAKKGNLKALKAFQYTEVSKETGEVLGTKPVENHPSVHIQSFWSTCVSSLDQLAHPSIESYDMPGIGGDISEISDGAGYFKYGDSIDSVSAEKRFGFWMKLSHATDIDDIIPKAITHNISAIKSQGVSWYSKISSMTKHMISGIQGSGSYNNAFRDGKKTTSDGMSTVKMTAQAYADALEMEEGTEIYKWLSLPAAMQNLFNNAEKGLILQNPGSMCCSVHPENTQHFGSHRMKIRYAKGAKGLNSFGSGSFSSEEEITTLPGARFVVLSVKHGNPKTSSGLDIELMMLPPSSGYLDELNKQ